VQNLLGGHSKNSVTLPYLEIVKIGNFIYRVFKKSSPLIFFWNIFTSVKSFCVKCCKFVGNSYPHISTNFYTFILIFHQIALIY